MIRLFRWTLFPTLCALLCLSSAVAAQRGYTLTGTVNGYETLLIDPDGEIVHEWRHDTMPGDSVYLTEQGTLLRAAQMGNRIFNRGGGTGGLLQEIGADGEILWQFDTRTEREIQHHDALPMPNGNVLYIGWELIAEEEARAAGANSVRSDLWSDTLTEINRDGEVVWRWRAWDHIVQDVNPQAPNYGRIADNPGRIDVNYLSPRGGDWLHLNSVAYNAELDQVMVSSPTYDELWVIDHSTTTAEAAGRGCGRRGKGGDLLYRWGNPAAYQRGSDADRGFRAQHPPHWIEDGLPGAGNILAFSNGARRERPWSEILEIRVPQHEDGSYVMLETGAWAPEAPLWRYSDPSHFYSPRISGAQRLPGGNTLIAEGDSGYLFEITPDGDIVWEYQVRSTTTRGGAGGTGANAVFRAIRYPADHPGILALLGEPASP